MDYQYYSPYNSYYPQENGASAEHITRVISNKLTDISSGIIPDMLQEGEKFSPKVVDLAIANSTSRLFDEMSSVSIDDAMQKLMNNDPYIRSVLFTSLGGEYAQFTLPVPYSNNVFRIAVGIYNGRIAHMIIRMNGEKSRFYRRDDVCNQLFLPVTITRLSSGEFENILSSCFKQGYAEPLANPDIATKLNIVWSPKERGNRTDPYSVLGLARNASISQVKAAFKALARKYHPDVNKEEGAAERFKAVKEAYTKITKPE